MAGRGMVTTGGEQLSDHIAVLSLNEANELAHALLAHIGQNAGIRVLSIKGLVADRYGLRPPRAAADADVMVDPARFDEYCALLATYGWHPRVEREVPSLLGTHSITLIRSDWPNDLDVHVRFPGFFAPDAVVFDRLWETRGEMQAAHVTIMVPSRAASAVIAGLHAVRYSRSVRHAGELELVGNLLRNRFDDTERGEFFDVARAGRAQWVLRELFAFGGVECEIDADARQRRLWELNRATVEDGAAVSWLAALAAAPWHRKPAVLVRALWISRAEIPRNDAARMPSTTEAWRHRLVRWRRGGIALLRYLLSAVRERFR
ncbi:MAG: hypothetical protein WAK00_08335 [Microbacterium sp.]|uniref:hypothetical protein n=1 Tax=Microbacterium sp. TaxID=51671 RepID=UPI003BB0A4DF